MPQASQRAHDAPPSPIRKLMPYADAAVKRGIRIYHLNIGQPDLAPPDEFWAAIKERAEGLVEYSNSMGNASLRDAAHAMYREMGIDLSPGQLIVTTAGSEAAAFALLSCTNPGDEVIVPEPMYANYLGFAVQAGVKIVPIATKIENDFALPDASEFESRITSKTKAIMICNPSNPTGTVYDQAQLLRLAEVVKKHDLFLIADEVYREFNFTGEPIPSVMNRAGLENNAVMIDSVSKRFALCGARIGFFVSRNADVMQGAIKFAQARLSPPAIEQIGVEGATKAPQSYFEGVRAEYQARLSVLRECIEKIDGAVMPKVEGAFYAMVRLPIDDADRFCQWLLEEFSLDGHTVMLAPGTGFYATPGAGADEVRIAYVLKSEDLRGAMTCLKAALATYPGRTMEQRSAVSI